MFTVQVNIFFYFKIQAKYHLLYLKKSNFVRLLNILKHERQELQRKEFSEIMELMHFRLSSFNFINPSARRGMSTEILFWRDFLAK